MSSHGAARSSSDESRGERWMKDHAAAEPHSRSSTVPVAPRLPGRAGLRAAVPSIGGDLSAGRVRSGKTVTMPSRPASSGIDGGWRTLASQQVEARCRVGDPEVTWLGDGCWVSLRVVPVDAGPRRSRAIDWSVRGSPRRLGRHLRSGDPAPRRTTAATPGARTARWPPVRRLRRAGTAPDDECLPVSWPMASDRPDLRGRPSRRRAAHVQPLRGTCGSAATARARPARPPG